MSRKQEHIAGASIARKDCAFGLRTEATEIGICLYVRCYNLSFLYTQLGRDQIRTSTYRHHHNRHGYIKDFADPEIVAGGAMKTPL